MQKKPVIAAATLAATVGLGFGLTQFANADPSASPSDQPSSSSTATPGSDSTSDQGGGQRGNKGNTQLASALATKLGLDEATVSTALDEVRTELGRLGRDATDEERAARRTEEANLLATKLGVSADQVTTALNEIQAERQAAEQAESDAVIDQAVTDGKLTADEAAAVKKAVEQGIVSTRGGGRG